MSYAVKEFSQRYLTSIILPFSEYMVNLMQDKLAFKFIEDPIIIKSLDLSMIDSFHIGIVVYLAEDVVVFINVPKMMAKKIAMEIFDMSEDDIDDEVLMDACLEYLNIVAGQALAIVPKSKTIDISTPFHVEHLKANPEDSFLHIPFRTDDGSLEMIFLPSETIDYLPKRRL